MIKHCKGCGSDLPLSSYNKSKAESDGLQRRCKDCSRANSRKHRSNNPEYYEKWYKDNKTKMLEYKRKHDRRKRQDPKDRLVLNIRSRTSFIVKSKGMIKSKKCREYLGCDPEFLIRHIEMQFIDGMTWDNYGEWEIDHIYPISKAKAIDDVYRLNHYTNLRPLWKLDNIRKRDKIEA